jgi:hypothetical protein
MVEKKCRASAKDTKKLECRVFLPRPVVELVDRWVEAGMGSNRSEVIRDILRDWALGRNGASSFIPLKEREHYGLCLNNFRVVSERGGEACFIGWRRASEEGKQHGGCKDCPEFVPYLSIVKVFRPEEEK